MSHSFYPTNFLFDVFEKMVAGFKSNSFNMMLINNTMSSQEDFHMLIPKYKDMLASIHKKFQAAEAIEALRYPKTSKEYYVEQFIKKVTEYFGHNDYRNTINNMFYSNNSDLGTKYEVHMKKLIECMPTEKSLEQRIFMLVCKMNMFESLVVACSSQAKLDKLEGRENQLYYHYLQDKSQEIQPNLSTYVKRLEKIQQMKMTFDQINDMWPIFKDSGIKFQEDNKDIPYRLNQLSKFIEMTKAKYQKQIDNMVYFIGQCSKSIEEMQNTSSPYIFLQDQQLQQKCNQLVRTINNLKNFGNRNQSKPYQSVEPTRNMNWGGSIQHINLLNYATAVSFIEKIAKISIDCGYFSGENHQFYIQKWAIFQLMILKKFGQILKIQKQNQVYKQFIRTIGEDVQNRSFVEIDKIESHSDPNQLKDMLNEIKKTLKSKTQQNGRDIRSQSSQEKPAQVPKNERSHLAYVARIYGDSRSVSEILKEDQDPKVHEKLSSLRAQLTKENERKLSILRDEKDELKQSIITYKNQLNDKDKQIEQLKKMLKEPEEAKIQEVGKRDQKIQELKQKIEEIFNQNKALIQKNKIFQAEIKKKNENQMIEKSVFHEENKSSSKPQPDIKIFTPAKAETMLFPSGSAFSQSQQFIQKLLQQIRKVKESSPIKINMLFSSTLNDRPQTKLFSNRSNILIIIKTGANTIIGGFTDSPFHDSNTLRQIKPNQNRCFLFSENEGRFMSLPLRQTDIEGPNTIVVDTLKFGKSEIRLNINRSYNRKVSFKLGEEGSAYSLGRNIKYEDFVGSKQKELNILVLEIYEFIYQSTKLDLDNKSQTKSRKGSGNIEGLTRIRSQAEKPFLAAEDKLYPPKPQSNTNHKPKDQSQLKIVDQRNTREQINFNTLKDKIKDLEERIQKLLYERDEELQLKTIVQTKYEQQIHTLEYEVNKLTKQHEIANATIKQQKESYQKMKRQGRQARHQQELIIEKLRQQIEELKKELELTKQKYEATRDKLLGKSVMILGKSVIEMSMMSKRERQENQSFEALNISEQTLLNQQEKQDVQAIKEELRQQFEKQIERVNQENTQLKALHQRTTKDLEAKLKQIEDVESKYKELQKQLEKNQMEMANNMNQISKFEQQALQLKKIKTDYENVLSSTLNNPISLKLQVPTLTQEYVHYSRTLLAADIFDRNEEDKTCLLNHITHYMKKKIIKTNLLYKFDPKNNTNVHHYIDKKRGLLCVVKTANAVVAGFYPGTLVQRGIMNEGGLLVSVTNNMSFPLLQPNHRNDSARLTYRGMTYDTFYIIFGNAEMRIRTGQKRIFSNFGISSSYYNNGGKRVNIFLNEGEQREVDFEYSEYYEVLFDEENVYRPSRF